MQVKTEKCLAVLLIKYTHEIMPSLCEAVSDYKMKMGAKKLWSVINLLKGILPTNVQKQENSHLRRTPRLPTPTANLIYLADNVSGVVLTEPKCGLFGVYTNLNCMRKTASSHLRLTKSTGIPRLMCVPFSYS